MSVAGLPRLAPVKVGYELDPVRPVLTFGARVDRASCPAPHRHPRAQLIFAQQGVLHVVAGRQRWVVPPTHAVWVPPGVLHQVAFPGPALLANLFLDPSAATGLPPACSVLMVQPLLRELIARAVEIGNAYPPRGPERRLMEVTIDELRRARASPLGLPRPSDPRVLLVTEALQADPADTRDLEAWAVVAGASPRTLARLFVAETGLTFGAWRRRLRLLEAVSRLAQGAAVTTVAFDVGYASVSAFSASFKRALGTAPRALRAVRAADREQDGRR